MCEKDRCFCQSSEFSGLNALLANSIHYRCISAETSAEGETLNGLWHGKGKIKYKNGAVFDGNFYYGKMEGWGILLTASNTTHIGDYKANKLWNGSGAASFSKSSYYEGEIVNGRYEGKGEFVNDGYEGEWKAGLNHGSGLEVHSDGSSYAGSYQFGKRNGVGIHCSSNKVVYKGQFYAGFKHGEGTIEYPNGKKFMGRFTQGRIQSSQGYFELNSQNPKEVGCV